MGACWSLNAQIKSHENGSSFLQIANASSSSTKVDQSERLGSRSEGEILESSNLKSFSFDDLKTATRNFRPDSMLGEGGFGCVYRGWVDEHTLAPSAPGSGMSVAVKRLKQLGFQGHREWLTEIVYLGQLQHPNLVKLIGYCLEDEHHLLVYEYMELGSLEKHLFYKSSRLEPLSWSLRMKIALEAAKGLTFLHSPEIKVIYRDFKASNILLDSNYDAKLSDFGLARDGPCGEISYVSTRVMGTQGYAAPEYLNTGHLTVKSDIYSFGVVLLEIMTGKRVIDSKRSSKEQNLVELSTSYLRKGKISKIMDSTIKGQCSSNSAKILGNLVLQCLSVDPRFRPNIKEIVSNLEQHQCHTDTDLYLVNAVKGRSRIDKSSAGHASTMVEDSHYELYKDK